MLIFDWIKIQHIAEAGFVKQAAIAYPFVGIFLDIPFLGDNLSLWRLYWGGMFCSASVLTYWAFAPKEFKHFTSVDKMLTSESKWLEQAANSYFQTLSDQEIRKTPADKRLHVYIKHIAARDCLLRSVITIGFIVGCGLILFEAVLDIYTKITRSLELIGI